ncbi:hypothetical protein CRYUN_Cryun22dG0108400 [Craigia yunnanensis]
MKVPPIALVVDMFGTRAIAEVRIHHFKCMVSCPYCNAPTLDKELEDDHVNNQKPLFIPGCKPISFVDSFEPILRRNNQVYNEYLRMGTETQQKTNATMLAEHTGIPTLSKLLPSKNVTGRSEIEAMVRKITVDKEGEAIRARVKMRKSCTEKALSKDGSSYNFQANMAKECEISLQSQNAKAGS